MIANVRRTLAKVIATVPGVNQVEESFNDRPPAATPAAWIGDVETAVTMGSREVWMHRIPVTIAVARVGDYGAETRATEAMIPAAAAVFRANHQLGHAVPGFLGLNLVRVTEGLTKRGGEDYHGVTFLFECRETFAATLLPGEVLP